MGRTSARRLHCLFAPGQGNPLFRQRRRSTVIRRLRVVPEAPMRVVVAVSLTRSDGSDREHKNSEHVFVETLPCVKYICRDSVDVHSMTSAPN